MCVLVKEPAITPAPHRTATRRLMLDAAVAGLQRHGVAGMSFTEVLRDSGAARGAIYHHFPGGKTQLVTEAAAVNADEVRAVLGALAGATPAEVLDAFLDAVRPAVKGSAEGGGCAVAALTVGAEPPLRTVASAAFDTWVEALTGRLVVAGMEGEEAAALATLLLAQLQGAHVLCRATGTLEPFDRAARAIRALAAAADASAHRG